MPRLAELLIATGESFVTAPVAEIELRFGGLPGDRHFGLTRESCSRTPWHPRRTVIANTRQVSIVSMEECSAVALDLGVALIQPAWLGANMAFRNVAALSALPPSTRIVFPSGATLFITEENVPCRYPGRVIAHEYHRPELATEFTKMAIGRRGVLALVEREGMVRADDRLRFIYPRTHRAKGEGTT